MFSFTPEQHGIIATLKAAHLYADAYRQIAAWAEGQDGVDPRTILWFYSAADINQDQGAFSTLIRSYTSYQYQLRFGTGLSQEAIQAASNSIAEAVLADVLLLGGIPTLERLGELDASVAAAESFHGDQALWSGNLLFLMLRDAGPFYANIINDAPGDAYDFLAMMKAFAEASGDATIFSSPHDFYDAVVIIWQAVTGGGVAAAISRGITEQSVETIDTLASALNDGDNLLDAAFDGKVSIASFLTAQTIQLGRVDADDAFSGTAGYDLMLGAGGSDQLTGAGGGDVLDGGTGADVLEGGDDEDDLFGRAGEDQLIGGTGDDYLSGGADGDTYIWHPGDGSDEIMDFGGSGRDVLRIDLTGSDILVGSILFESVGSELRIGIGDETITIVDDGLPSGAIEDIVIIDRDGNEVGGTQTGTDGNDLLIGSSGSDALWGEQGNDVLIGGAGDDQLYGGGFLGNGFLGAGIDLLLGGSGHDYLLGQVHHLFASGGTLMGGEGYDTYNIAYLSSTVRSDSPTSIFYISDSDHQGEIGIHNAWLSYADFYRPGIQWELVVSQNQVFRLAYSELDHSLRIREYSGINGFLLAGQVVIQDFRNGDFGINLYGLNHDLTGTERSDSLRGGAGNDVLRGLEGDDQLEGGLGADNLYGGGGNDTIYADHVEDLVFENAGEGTDTVDASTSHYLYANVENLVLEGAGDLFGVGNTLANIITGNTGSNLLIGGDGDDTLNGGAGVDSLFGEAGADTLNGDAGVDYLVGGTGDDTLDGGANADAIYGEDGNDSLTGGAGFVTDILVGGSGNDTLYANSGSNDYDLIDGGAGDDNYHVDTGADLTFEAVGGGTDTVYANVSNVPNAGVYLYANVENLVLGGTTAFGVGNELANTLTGSASANWLLGGSGNDTLNGKAGNDVLFGEAGGDTFVFDAGSGADVIGDFNAAEDMINLDAYNFASFTELSNSFHQVGDDGAIDLGGGNIIVLHGVAMSTLNAGDFVL